MLDFLKRQKAEEKEEITTLSKIQIQEGDVWQIEMGINLFLYCFRETREGVDGIVIDSCRYKNDSSESKEFIPAGKEIKINDAVLWEKYRTPFRTGDEMRIKYIGNGNLEIRYAGLKNMKLPQDSGPEIDEPVGEERHLQPVHEKYYELAQLPKGDSLGETVDEQRQAIREGVYPKLLEGIDIDRIDWEAGYTGDWDGWPPLFDIRKIKGPNPEETNRVIRTLTDFAGSENAIGLALTGYLSNLKKINKSQIKEFIRKEYGFLF